MKKIVCVVFLLFFAVFMFVSLMFKNGGVQFVSNEHIQMCTLDNARSGCCSHHGGVCGCRGARALCCDGSLSPSCGCD